MRGLFRRSINGSEVSVTTEEKRSKTTKDVRGTQDILQYREIVDLEGFETDLDLWFAKATLMHAIATIMISENIDPPVDDTPMDIEDVLKNLVLSYERENSGNSIPGPQIPFKTTKLFKELRATRIQSKMTLYDKTTQEIVQSIRADRLAETFTELDASTVTTSHQYGSRDSGLHCNTPPSTSKSTGSSVSHSRHTATSSCAHLNDIYNHRPSPPNPATLCPSLPTAQDGRHETSSMPIPVGQWIDGTCEANNYAVCTKCHNRSNKLMTQRGQNEGRWYFKCTADTCKAWCGWSKPGTTSATENRCFCGVPGTGIIDDDRIFKYRCSRGSQGCGNWAYYP